MGPGLRVAQNHQTPCKTLVNGISRVREKHVKNPYKTNGNKAFLGPFPKNDPKVSKGIRFSLKINDGSESRKPYKPWGNEAFWGKHSNWDIWYKIL